MRYLDRLLRRWPSLALLGFFPPIWLPGIPVCWVVGVRTMFGRDTDLGLTLGLGVGLVMILVSPVWPYPLYRVYRANAVAC